VTDRLRRAGRGRDGEGWWAIWSVAEGRRGRRWREVRSRDVHVRSSLLLETDPEGRFSHMELSTASGLLTLHPEADGTLHGNTVAADGIEHVRGRPWDRDGIVLVEGSVIAAAAAAALLGRRQGTWTAGSHPSVWIPTTLWLELQPARVERITESTWRIGRSDPLELDPDGLPVLADGATWPLEE
jgi:hypothetical protein